MADQELAAVDVVGEAMASLATKRPIFHSEADFQHALAWEVQLGHPAASLRLEKRVAVAPNIELDLLIDLGGARLGVELKYPRRAVTAEVDGEVFTLRTGADDHSRYFAVEDCARLERLVDEEIIDSGVFVLLTNVTNVWMPSTSASARALRRVSPARRTHAHRVPRVGGLGLGWRTPYRRGWCRCAPRHLPPSMARLFERGGRSVPLPSCGHRPPGGGRLPLTKLPVRARAGAA